MKSSAKSSSSSSYTTGGGAELSSSSKTGGKASSGLVGEVKSMGSFPSDMLSHRRLLERTNVRF